MNDDEIKRAAEIIRHAEHLIALTGAGVSRESNIPTFRGKDGLWRNYDPMDLATPSAFARDSQLVWEWYEWRQGLIASCEPNPAHYMLAAWERKGLLKTVITQNVDGLHRRAGSEHVLEVHGNIWAVKCVNCSYHALLDRPAVGVPRCPECGDLLRPDVVWFGESLDPDVISKVYAELDRADVCLIIGTSAVVQPAASFPLVVKNHGGTLIEINVEPTPLTTVSEISLQGKAGHLLPLIDTQLDS
ncbi:MAG: NAD-dependent deacylase [Candidatus Thorarchaeota archaeon]|nr:NAD-dependent deacylase [Candidatus Thorarchaeota archaeon]